MALLLGLSGWALAQGTGEVWGRVVDSKTGTTIPGVNVFVKTGTTMIGVQTDANGQFRLKSLPPGIYTINFTFVGYGEGKMEMVTVYAESIIKTQDYALEAGVDLSPIIIEGNKVIGTDPVIRMPSATIQSLPDHKDIKKIVSRMSADVQATDDGALYFRGARDDDFVYYVDGVKMKGDNVKVPSLAIGSLQVYTGGVPARYGDFTGGCVVIETQSYFDWLNSRN